MLKIMRAMQTTKRSISFILILLLVAVISVFPLAQTAHAANIEIEWTPYSGTGTSELEWNGVVWSPELGKIVAVGEHIGVGTSDLTMSSPDGESWTPHPEAVANEWFDVTWSPKLGMFVAVAPTDPSAQPVMTSPDGENWTAQSVANTGWTAVTWSPDLGIFVAVRSSSPAVMTSPDGVNWTTHTAIGGSSWEDVTWSPELGLFVAIAETGTDQIMTSPDGESWTARTSPESNPWRNVTWSPELSKFVAVADSGSTSRAMTSSDGINWTSHTTPISDWETVTWSGQLGMFVAMGSGGPRGTMVSSDGENWTLQPTPNSNTEIAESIIWVAELRKFVAVSGSNRVLVGTPQPTIPNAPLNLQATTLNDSEIQLSWDASTSDNPYSPITGYKIERNIAGGPFSVLVANTNSTDTTYLDTRLEPGTAYSYRVSAINAAGTSTPSNVVAATTQATLAATGTSFFTYVILASTLTMGGAATVIWSTRKKPASIR